MEFSESSVSELITQVRGGNQTVFSKIVDIYSPLINSMVSKFNINRTDMETQDLKQEAVIALYNAVCTYNPEKREVSFGLYAKICIRNRLISEIRRQNKRNLKKNTSNLYYETDPEKVAISRENIAHLMNIIDKKLTPYEKSVFWLYILDYSYRTIANSLGTSEKSVDNAVYRIKAKIKKLI